MQHRRWWLGAAALILIAQPRLAAAGSEPPPLPPRRPALEAATPASAPAPVPLPPSRPTDLLAPLRALFGPPAPPPPKSPTPPPTTVSAPSPEPAPTPGAPVPAEEELACARLFGSGKVEARALEPIGGTGGCGIGAPIELSAVVVSPARRIRFEPPVTIGCPLGEVVADWVRLDLAPAFDQAASPLAALSGTSGYACRGRNNISGAKLSEHGKGRAVDIGGFRSADGRTVGVKDAQAPILATVRRTACARFSTILGPGSDGFHESHLHVDVEVRKHATVLCQWDLPEQPPAVPRPGTERRPGN